MALSQQQIAAQMIAQLRMLDPSVSAEVGTPERKILDTVAQANADSQIDLVGLQSALDLDSKYGAALDRFLAIFGFGRQKATYATGFVTFSRTTPSNFDIPIRAGAQVKVPVEEVDERMRETTFYTTFDVTLRAGQTDVVAPVRASLPGNVGNVAANRVTMMVGTPVLGITAVTNDAPITGGLDQESDEEFKVRFKNTVFRNLAGTRDQYLALAIATAFTTKANVVGPVSLYREYIQVPPVDDPTGYDVDGRGYEFTGGGTAGEYTTALSTIPYAQHIYDNLPSFVSNGRTGLEETFYRAEVDFRLNLTDQDRLRGDTLRYATANIGSLPTDAPDQPNVTFLNVYTGSNAAIQAVRPGDVVLLEYSYLSDASRNDPNQRVANAIDVFIDGGNIAQASTVVTRPSLSAAFVDDYTSKYHYENYRRKGQPYKRPVLGNVLSPLYWQPVTDLPDEIIVGVNTYMLGVHYWAVEDVSELGGTIRARGGIEWSTTIPGSLDDDPEDGPFTGSLITDLAAGTAVEITDYSYDRNVIDLQGAYEGSRQIATDVLAHRSKTRFFKLDITVMYEPGVSQLETNAQVHVALNRFLQSQYFGATVQLSDLLQVIHDVPGIDNVRWSNDTPQNQSLIRVQECNMDGSPLLGVELETIDPYAMEPRQRLYIYGQPTGGTFKLGNGAALLYNETAESIQANLRTSTSDNTITAVEERRSPENVTNPIRSFIISKAPLGLEVVSNLTGGPTVIRNDFFIRDDELISLPVGQVAGDTLPGLIIRPRAQHTWVRG